MIYYENSFYRFNEMRGITPLARVVTLAVAVMLYCGAAAGVIVHDMETTPPDIRIIGPLDDTNSFLGSSLAAGDINGDGIDELAVGPGNDGANGTGSVYIVYGSSGFTPGSTIDFNTESADLTIHGIPGSWFGQRLTFGDVNGDGIDDLAVSASYAESSPLGHPGRAYVFYGSTAFPPNHVIDLTSPGSEPDITVEGPPGGYMTCAVIGDITGDGRADLFFRACPEAYSGGYPGHLFCIFGRPSHDPFYVAEFDADLTVIGEGLSSYDSFGGSIVLADFNRDGMKDIIAGVLRAGDGKMYGILGSDSFPPRCEINLAWEQADLEVTGRDSSGILIGDVFPHDINHDGWTDVLFDTSNIANGSPRFAALYSPSQCASPYLVDFASASPDFTLKGPFVPYLRKYASGDVNADSFDDFVILAPYEIPPGSGSHGVVFVADGSTPFGVGSCYDLSADPAEKEIWGRSRAGVGSKVITLDINGDGAADIALGAGGEGSNTGEVYVIFGMADADWDGLSDSMEAAAGMDPHSADTDGDGIGDYDEVNYNGDPDYDPYDPGTGEGADLNATSADTDGDGWRDALEVACGSDPIDPLSIVSRVQCNFQPLTAVTPPGYLACGGEADTGRGWGWQ